MSLMVITGASSGFGRSLAISWATKLNNDHMIIMARSLKGLSETQSMIKKVNPGLNVIIHVTDFSKPEKSDFEDFFFREQSLATTFDRVYIVHNAGTLEHPQGQMVRDKDDLREMQKYFTVSLFSVVILNSVFINFFQKGDKKIPEMFVVNISSLAALQPFDTWGLYCTGKASREMIFRTLASESSDIRVLNYAPGPLDTPMISDVLADPNTSETIRSGMTTLLKPEDSAKKLCGILENNDFISGAHIDYFDV